MTSVHSVVGDPMASSFHHWVLLMNAPVADGSAPQASAAVRAPVHLLQLATFRVGGDFQPIGQDEFPSMSQAEVAVSIGRRGLDDRGFVVEVHEFMQRVKDTFSYRGEIGPQLPMDGRRRSRVYDATCEQVALGVARVAYDMLGDDLDRVVVTVLCYGGSVTLNWVSGDPLPVYPKLHGSEASADMGEYKWTRRFSARNVTALLANNFRCGTPDGVDDSFRCEVTVSGTRLRNGVMLAEVDLDEGLEQRFHPHERLGTPEDAPRTQGGSRIFIASCERLAAGVAFTVLQEGADRFSEITVSVQNATGMVTYAWKAGDAMPAFPQVADQQLTDATYEERLAARRSGRSASNYC